MHAVRMRAKLVIMVRIRYPGAYVTLSPQY
jgi:hypothetical protein